MKSLKILLIFIMMYSLNIEAQDLSDYKWKNRIVILYENDTNTTDVKSALEIIDTNVSKFTERDILVFVYKDDVFYNTNRETTGIKKTEILSETYDGYILTGKDGGIKSKATYPFNLEKLLDLIDSMPMSKSEMRYNK
ncbi:DUF4174 domain-containing protein [Maribacter sp. 1_MG-2023]|uniref:DUF4174 domain-containing protein n=1 Tax=Maribacter sp. 1_MG-2023 TaxID=3062677 RepID=UPI0026E121B2|nr:DUF4174 domain-containing protein [Maribacter sp. 1_MG-2023]MDO6473015.1 DUF4174 domain-containing protein [Maribacter sp. 1_MG-2023]